MSNGPVLVFGLLDDSLSGLLNPLGDLDFGFGDDDQMD
jgi:hypothetical protein